MTEASLGQKKPGVRVEYGRPELKPFRVCMFLALLQEWRARLRLALLFARHFEALLHDGLLFLHLRLGGIGFHNGIDRATHAVNMAADEEDRIIHLGLDVRQVCLEEAHLAQEFILRQEVLQRDALGQQAGIGLGRFDGGKGETAAARAQLGNPLALRGCEGRHGWQAVSQLLERFEDLVHFRWRKRDAGERIPSSGRVCAVARGVGRWCRCAFVHVLFLTDAVAGFGPRRSAGLSPHGGPEPSCRPEACCIRQV